MTGRQESATPLVSVIMPVWGAEGLIEASMSSVLDSDMADLELILVDDVSPDGSIAVAERVAADRGDTRVRVVRRETNGGVSAARNTGLDHARGTWVCFIDNDDAYAPAFLSTLLAGATEPDVDLVCARPTRILADGTRVPPPPVAGWPTTVDGREAARLSLLDRISVFPWDKLYRRGLFDGLRFPEGILYEDMVLSTLLCLRARRVRLLPDAPYDYLTRASSQTWKDLPPVSDLTTALAVLTEGLGAEATAPVMRAPLLRREALMTLILAQRALLHRPPDPAARATLAHCRRRFDARTLLALARVDRFLALAGLGLRLLPRVYGAVYGRYVRRTFRLPV